MLGASTFRIADVSTGVTVDPAYYGVPDGKTVIYRKTPDSVLTTLLLPSQDGKIWKIEATKDPSMSRLKVFVTVPKEDGRVSTIGYTGLQTSESDSTSVEFLVGIDNKNLDVLRTGPRTPDVVKPSYVHQFNTSVPTVSNLSARSRDGDVKLTWINPAHPRLSKVRVLRKYSGVPADYNDGSVLAEGMLEAATDRPAYPLAFYSVFAFDGSDAMEAQSISIDTRLHCITGRVIDSISGLPQSGVEVIASDAAGLLRSSTSGRDGAYAICSLSPGNYNVSVRTDGTGSIISTVPIAIGPFDGYLDFDTARGPLTATFTMNTGDPSVDTPLTFSGASNGGVTDWRWSFGDGSTGAGQNVSHTYRSQGRFEVTLRVSNGINSATARRTIDVGPPSQRLALSRSRVRVDVTWRSQYTGATGTAFALPQSDNFGYFYFSDRANPEVFVKVLDFGTNSPYLLFYAGLTDFEYTVTYTNVATGGSVKFTKPAGSLNGWGDDTSLPHVSVNGALWDGTSDHVRPVPPGFRVVDSGTTALLQNGVPEPRQVHDPVPSAVSLALANGTVQVSVTYRNQYSDQTGTAQALPQGDQFGFFYFSDPGNPEVFVKVLDWGADKPYLIFYAGLTDFEYTVSFRHVQTGQVVAFKKNAGTYNGGADNTSLKHGAPCSFSLNPASASVPVTGYNGSFGVIAGSGCAWTASSTVTWISVTSGASGTGSGTVGYSVATNTGAARSGTITAGGQTFTVNQAGAPASPQEITITLPGNVPLALVKIPAGTFQMGSPEGERGRRADETLHEVTLTSDYYMGKYEVTQGQWEAVMGSNPSGNCGSKGIGSQYPVYCVSWNDIAGTGGFLEKLNAYLTATGQAGAGKYGLPTEAQWERAARAGTQTRLSFGDALSGADNCGSNSEANPYVWWCNNSGDTSHEVGTKSPNGYGLYDMHGNVSEWVEDWSGKYGSTAQTDPTGPALGYERVRRGGAWYGLLMWCRCADRADSPPFGSYFDLGFRLSRLP